MVKPAISPTVKLNNGREIPVFGLGTWKSDPGKVKEAVKYALLEGGYRHIDCAYVYQNQKEVGEALKEVFATGELKREDVFITSKCWNTYHPRSKVMENLKETLAELGLEYLDLYLIHWPMGYKEDTGDLFPTEGDKPAYSDSSYLDTWKGMEDCHKAGLCKSIGVSNFNSVQLSSVIENAEIKPVMNQFECHPYLTQAPLIEFCKSKDVLVTAYSPLGSPDRPWAAPGDPSLLEEATVRKIAEEHKKTSAQVLLRFSIQRGLITIPKSVTPSRITENIDIFDFVLTEQNMKDLEAFNRNWRVCELGQHKGHKDYPFNIPF